MTPIESQLETLVRRAVEAVLGEPWDGPVPVEISNRPELGDYATPVAFQLARVAKRPPLQLAEALASALADSGAGDVVGTAEATAPAFVNIRLAPEALGAVVRAAHAAEGRLADRDLGAGGKVVIEHTNINPNKAAHVGHFRNACLGDSLARILRRLGYRVEVQNYIDDTGVQVADVVVAFERLDLPDQGDEPFDRYCSAAYTAVQQAYDADPDLKAHRATVQAAIESGEGESAELARDVTRRVAAANLRTMWRAGVAYDLLTWESHILSLGFWDRTFELLKERGAVTYEESGPNAGCWVMPFGLGTVEAEAGETVTEDKVLVTSRGIATYTAKDLAYQLWKFGRLGLDFGYRPFDLDTGQPGTLWTTAPPAEGQGEHPDFAGADRVINVIDASQSYPQQVVYEGLRRAGFEAAADASEHLGYGFVTLTPAAARALGADVDADATSVAMSGRAGLQIFADDLLDRLTALVAERTGPDAAAAVAAGAARYYMLKFSNNQEIAFDFDDALRTTGETGVYLQYAYVRASGILRKLDAAEASQPPQAVPDLDRALALRMADYPRILASAGSERSVMTLAKYAFDLASAFNAFYDNTTPVVAEEDAALKAWRAGLVAGSRLVLGDCMDLLGIPRLERL